MRKILGIGETGNGHYSWSNTRYIYNLWHNMLSRCYSKHLDKYTPSYADVYVSKRWLKLQTFGNDIENMLNYGLEDFELDKDLLVLDNKCYSRKRCIFIPQQINTLFWTGSSSKYGRGVHLINGRYSAALKMRGTNRKRAYLGCFGTPEEAQQAVKEAKIEYAKALIKKFRRYLPEQVRQNILCKVENYE